MADDNSQQGRLSVGNIGDGTVDFQDWVRLANSSPVMYLGATTGSGDTYVATLSPALPALYTGLLVVVKLTNANTGAASLNINGLGAKALTVKGSTPADNAFDAGGHYMFVYDGTNFDQVDPA